MFENIVANIICSEFSRQFGTVPATTVSGV